MHLIAITLTYNKKNGKSQIGINYELRKQSKAPYIAIEQFTRSLCISQFQLRPSPPPGQLWGICTHCQSRGSGIS